MAIITFKCLSATFEASNKCLLCHRYSVLALKLPATFDKAIRHTCNSLVHFGCSCDRQGLLRSPTYVFHYEVRINILNLGLTFECCWYLQWFVQIQYTNFVYALLEIDSLVHPNFKTLLRHAHDHSYDQTEQ